MVQRAGTPDDGEVPRVVVLWTRPQHLSPAAADSWVRQELGRLRAVTGLQEVQLSRLDPAAAGSVRAWDWMLELQPKPGADAALCLDSAAWREWARDLRLLGMQPTVLVADTARVLAPEPRA
jgi:hypothetical protein